PDEDTKAQDTPFLPQNLPEILLCRAMPGFYSNAFKVGVGLIARLGRFDDWESRAGFLSSALRHALVIAFRVPLTPRLRTLRFSVLSFDYVEFTGELGNIRTVVFDADVDLPLPPAGATVIAAGGNLGLFTLFLI